MNNQYKLIRDIKAIAYHIQNNEGLEIKMDDLSHKLELLVSEFEEQQAIEEGKLNENSKEHFDVAILTVIPKEFKAINMVFNFRNEETNSPEYQIINGLRLWKSSIKQKRGRAKDLNTIFGVIGIAGNLPSYLETNTLLKEYNIDLIILCGIAAGRKEKNSIYSAIVGDNIVYYENQKLISSNKQEYRLKPITVDDIRGKDFTHLEGRQEHWKAAFLKLIEDLKIDELNFQGKDWININWKNYLKIEIGSILSGEKLFADGQSLDHLAEISQIGKATVAGEMEGYGFSYACRQNKHTDWLIFRGISDYGGSEKGDEVNQEYQILAAISSAVLIKEYLEHIYIPREE